MTIHVEVKQLPPIPDSLLAQFAGGEAFCDSYMCEWPSSISLAQWLDAFYSSRVFAPEKWVIKRFAGKPCEAEDLAALAHRNAAIFAMWKVVERNEEEILLRDVTGRTCSWLAVKKQNDGGVRLYFGSCVFPKGTHSQDSNRTGSNQPQFGFLFHALLGFHAWYSKALLRSGVQRLIGKAAMSDET